MALREILHMADAAAWDRWLAEHHADSPGVRLAIAKKGADVTSPTYAEALDAALCWGWIDSVKHRLDDRFFTQTFGPRGPRSIWSERNREHVERLAAEGRLRAPGVDHVERAKADGRWAAAYGSARTIEVPDDLRAALDAAPLAAAAFAVLDGTNRYAFLFRIATVKRAETRARKILETVAMLERGALPYPRRSESPGT